VALFRKKETYNEQMLREAGLDRVVLNTPQPPPEMESTMPRRGIDYSRLSREWDTVATAVAPGIAGDRVKFTALPNGDLIVSEEDGDGDLSPFADAIEEHVSPPYHAAASRQDGDLWGIGAKRIEVVQFSFPGADALELFQRDGAAQVSVNGAASDAAAPVELQRLGERVGADFCVEAKRIDGDYWEVEVSPL
jgi:hypothetical protein